MSNNLPGPAFVVSLMLTAILAVWLGLFGPLDLPAIFNKAVGFADQLDPRPILISFAVASGLVVVALLVGRTFSKQAISPSQPIPELKPLLSAADWVRFRRSFRIVMWLVGGIAALHGTAAVSVLPYVWVSDLSANCGARLVLDRAVGEMMIVLLYVLMAILGILLIRAIDLLQEFVPPIRKVLPSAFDDGKKRGNIVLKQMLVPLSAAVLCLITVFIGDLQFLRNPPNVPPADDKTALEACAHPKDTASWGYTRVDLGF